MAYGKIKADTFVYDNSGSDVEVTLSSLGSKANLPASAGTVGASEVVQVDANKDITGFRNVTLSGDLTVNGTTTTINSTTLAVDDKNIELGSVDTPSDTTADGGGITLKGATDKTIVWNNAQDSWIYNQNITVETGVLNVKGPEGASAALYLISDEGDDSADTWRVVASADNNLYFQNYTTGAYTTTLKLNPNGALEDSKGDVRKIPQVGSLSANYTLATGDTGKHILTNTKDIIVPNSTFSAGDAITLVNNGATPTTITKNITNLYNPVDGSTPTALAAKGMCTILFVSGTEAYISGAGLS